MTYRQDVPLLLAVVAIGIAALCMGMREVAAATSPAKLEWHFYKVHNTCREAEEYIRHQVTTMCKTDNTISAKLLRLVSSDCLTNGCDASVLLDGPSSEKTAPQNRGLGGFVVIDKIKTVLEQRCPGVVSCADILHLATRDAVHLAGAPSYPVLTGRRDGMTSSAASVDLPSPSISYAETLAYFESKGLNVLDMVTLLGAHSMGKTHCSRIEDRLYNFNKTRKPDPTMNASFLSQMRKQCPPRDKKGQADPLVYLNQGSNSFTQSYYTRALNKQAVLGVDQQIIYGDDGLEISQEFAASFEDFRRAFAYSMDKMGSIKVLTGTQGEIRQNCHYTNK